MALKTYNEWRQEQAPTFLEEAEEFRKWVEDEGVAIEDDSEKIELTEEEWLEVKGIGPKLAKRLVENGPLPLEEIENIKGIRSNVLSNIKIYLAERTTP
jgi:predicted flap endonuclease-1-like 5' DNA nuclease